MDTDASDENEIAKALYHLTGPWQYKPGGGGTNGLELIGRALAGDVSGGESVAMATSEGLLAIAEAIEKGLGDIASAIRNRPTHAQEG